MYNGLQFDEVKAIISKYCSFSLSIELINELKPITNKLYLKQVNKQLTQALQMTISYGEMPFGGIKDITSEVNYALKDGTLRAEELLKIADQAYGIEQINKYISSIQCEKDAIKDLTDSLVSFKTTANRINQCISSNGEIYDNASSDLNNIRKNIKSLQRTIATKMGSFVSSNASYLQDNIIATRNDRSVILVKNSYKNVVDGIQYGTSSSGAATYVEPSCVIEFNNKLQQAYYDEKSEIEKILYSLSQLVKRDGVGYLANVNTLALLDSLFARSIFGKQYSCVIGNISDGDLIIEKARHPLIDQSKVVANSYHMINPIKTILITGPNTGGKTVSLKVIGLFSLMFLSGMPLPCERAEIPFFDHIYYDIGDNQSIDDDLSTFGSHIKTISNICQKANSSSLVIIDELGSSTDPIEGQALACAVLDYLRKKDIYVVATTHFSKLKAFAKTCDNILISSVQFDQVNLKPTYRYIENSVGQSNALEIAKRYGLKDEILKEAYQFKQQQQSKSDIALEKIEKELDEINQRKQEIANKQNEINEKLISIDSQKNKLEIDKAEIINRAKLEAENLVLEAKEKSDELIKKLKQKDKINIKEIAEIKNDFSEILPEDGQEIDDTNFKVGDNVKITLTNQMGEILEINKNNAIINCYGLKITSSLSNLVKTAKPVEKKENVRTKVKKQSSFTLELNVIGLTSTEALEEVDKFLDTALVNNAPFVRIVHGVGEGILRKAIWDKLKRYKFVEKFEQAPLAQGGSGATIVTFKG